MADVLKKIPVTGVFPSKDFLVVVSQKDHVADVLQVSITQHWLINNKTWLAAVVHDQDPIN